jgi:restriction system protein
MSRRSAGFVNTWAEAQHQYQRQMEAEERRRRHEARQERDGQRRAAQEYREYRQAEARRLTEELDARVAALQSLLAEGCLAPAFRVSSLLRVADVPPFDPGRLAWPVAMPDPDHYQPQGGGWSAGRRAQAQTDARSRFEYDWHAAQAAEAQRQQQLAAARYEYERWARAQRTDVGRHNDAVTEAIVGLERGDPESVVEYFSAALYSSAAWPGDFPRQVTAAFDPAARQLVLDWELPGYDIVPESKSVRYMLAEDRDKEVARPVTQRRALYREVLAQSVLLVLQQLFAADEYSVLDSVA